MSHFSVLVIASDLEVALQPFHEFECTGISDQYVIDVDRTEEARQKFAASTATRLKAPDGTLQSFFDEAGNWRTEFSQPDSGSVWDTSRRTYFVPKGYEKVEVPTSQVESFAEWATDYYGCKIVSAGQPVDREGEHKFGHVRVNEAGEVEALIDRTNPNKKWDWWTVGGRWSDKLLGKDGKWCDAARAGDVDWDGMVQAKGADAGSTYDAIFQTLNGRPVITWNHVLARFKAGELTIEQAREIYNGQPIVEELIKAEAIDSWDGADTLSAVMSMERSDFIRREGETNASTWALLHDGKWSERGSMGWFGMSDADDGSTAKATADFWSIVRGLPADTQVTVVDCHI